MIITKSGADVFAPTDAAGALRSPVIGEAQTWAIEVENAVASVENAIATSEAIYSTRALLYADLTPAAPALAWVLFDPTPGYNGVYSKSGASGAGSWARVAPLPFAVAFATATGGTSSVIYAASDGVAVTTDALICVTLATTNASSPMFISFNGGTTQYRIKTSSSTDVSVGGLVGTGAMLGRIIGTDFRLFSDQASAAIQAAAAASAASAEAAAVSAALSEANAAAYMEASFDASVGIPRPATYTGLVTTRGMIPSVVSTTDKQVMSTTYHFARDPLTAVQLVYANWYVSATSVETNGPGTITVKASVEYPIGTFTPVKWSGATSVSITAGSTYPPSGSVLVAVPGGAKFFVHTWAEGASGVVLADVKHAIGGDRCEYAASGLVDKTDGASEITDNTGTNYIYGPVAIIGLTSKPTIMIVGDSRNAANNSTVHFDPMGNKGNVAHAFAPHFAGLNASRSARTMAQFNSSHAKQVALAAYCSDVVIQIGINDLSGGASAATALSRLTTLIGYFTGKRIWLATIEPWSTSIDGWTTVDGQTVAAWDAERTGYNDGIRAGIAGTAGYFEFADVVETARNSGKWRIFRTGVAPTSDGVHINDNGHRDANRVGAFDPRRIYAYPELTRRIAMREDVDTGEGSDLLVTVGSLNRARLTASLSADQTGITSSGATIAWDTFDASGGMEKWVASTGRVYPPRGRYWVSAQIEIKAAGDNELSFIRVYVSDVKVAEASCRTKGTSNFTLSIVKSLFFDGLSDNIKVSTQTTSSTTTVSAGVSQSWLQLEGI